MTFTTDLEKSAHALVFRLDVSVSDVAHEMMENLHLWFISEKRLCELRELVEVERKLVEGRRLRLGARSVTCQHWNKRRNITVLARVRRPGGLADKYALLSQVPVDCLVNHPDIFRKTVILLQYNLYIYE